MITEALTPETNEVTSITTLYMEELIMDQVD